MSSHLNEPQTWSTGSEPATSKQKAFLQTLSASHPSENLETAEVSEMDKSTASAKIDELKSKPAEKPDAPLKNADGKEKEGNLLEKPEDWATGDDEATGKQMGYIAVMAKQAGESVPGKMGKGEASQRIEELKKKTGM